jgi:cytochrome c-type biogenesis protein CcmH/NrfG
MAAMRTRVRTRTRLFAPYRTALLVILVLAGGLVGVLGCAHYLSGVDRQFWQGVRPVSDDVPRLLRNAHYLKLTGRQDLAVKELEEAYQREPSNLKVVNQLAQCHEELGNFTRAQQLYQEALVQHSSNPALNNNLCYCYFQAGQWEQAEACFRQVLAKDPQNAAARNNLGLLLCRLGRVEEAQRLWREAEGEVAARHKLGQVLTALGQKVPAAYAQPAPPAAGVAKTPAPAAVRQPAPPPAAKGAPAPAPVQVAGPAAPEAAPAVAAPPPAPPAARTLKPETPAPVALKVESPPAAKPAPPPPLNPAPASAAAAASPEAAKAPALPARPAPPAATAASPAATPGPPLLAPAPAPTRGVQPSPAEPVQPRPMMKAREKAPESRSPAALKPQARTAPKTRVAKAASVAPAKPTQPRPLTEAELAGTGIEVRNGAGLPHLARRTRLLLSLEGFTVTRIGNHIDFGADKTVIYFRPEAARVAQALNARFFQVSRLEESTQLPEGVAVKIILGHDLADLPELGQRLALRPRPATPAVSPESGPAPDLSPQELRGAALELRNGNGAKHIARRTRTLLTRQGFRVARIGNHRDFGAETTVIYYRSEAARVAQALNARFFKTSRMEANPRLPRGVQVKVILGRDLLHHQELLTSLVR